MARPRKADINADIAREVRQFFQEREGASDENENRQQMTDDLRFCYEPGAQWDQNARLKRQGRPCYTYNRTVGAVNQVIGDQRQARPSCKVRAVNKQGSTKVADTFGGIIRNIEAQSGAEAIYDESFKYAVAGAWGAWRIVPEYTDDESFDQELRIKRIPNPQTVYFDENADPFGRGSMRCVVAERISVEKYKKLYGIDAWTNVQVARDSQGWVDDTQVRIAEYYRMDCRERTIALLSNGRTETLTRDLEEEIERHNSMLEPGEEAITILRKRKVKDWYVTWYKVDGATVLEGPIEYGYRFIPVVRLPGRYVNIEGKQLFQSLIRHAKDAQRTYNFERSQMVETVALTPRAPYLVTANMIKGYEDQWKNANISNSPYLEYDPDDRAPQGPRREPPPDVPAALIALSQQSAEDIKQTTGYVNPALDQPQTQGPESGVALRNRMLTGDSGSFEFLDHFAKAIKYTWEILIDMIPVHYDTERVVRILGEDGQEGFVTINGVDEDGVKRILSEGRYDVTVTLGPAYATQRLESLDTLLEATERMPIIAEVAPDIIIRNMDVQGADEIERRVRRQLIERGIVEPTEEEAEEIGPPPPPDPAQVALVESLQARAQKDAASAAKTQVEAAEKMAQANTAERREFLEIQKLMAEIVHQQAETRALIKELLESPGSVQSRLNVNV